MNNFPPVFPDSSPATGEESSKLRPCLTRGVASCSGQSGGLFREALPVSQGRRALDGSHLPDMNVQVFQPRDSALLGDIETAHRQIELEGRFWPSYTPLDGHPQHRMVLINPATQASDLTTLLDRLTAIHQQLSSSRESTEHLSAKGRSVPPVALLHSSPAHRPKDGSRGSTVD